MRRLQLYIGNERVDLFKDETVSLTQTIKNVKDLKKVFTEFTQTFSVPASRTNNKIFKHYYNFNISGGFDARKKSAARLELNDLPFKDGKIELQGVELKNNLAHTYKITFYGNTVDLKDILGDAQLSSLAFNGLNKSYKFSEIRDALSPLAIFDADKIIAPFITHTNRLIYDSSSHVAYDPEATTNNLYHQGISNKNQNGVAWNQFKYAIRVQQIINEIQFRYPEIQFSDDFFNDTDNEKFYNLFMWLHRKSGHVEPATQVEVIYTKLEDLISTNTQVVSSVDGGVIFVSASQTEGYFASSIRVRLNPNTDAKTLSQISTGKKENKFGVNKNTFYEIINYCKNSKNIDLKCLSVHIGSQILDHRPYEKMLKAVSQILSKTNHKFEFIDLGGGMGITYTDKNKKLNYKKYNTAILKFLRKNKVKIIFEPGRSIIGDTGTLVTKIIYIKDSGSKKFIILDAAMNDLMRPALYGAFHKTLPVTKSNKTSKKPYEFVGPICESTDKFVTLKKFQVLNEKDLIAICDVGAYGMSLSSNYNLRPKPIELLIKGSKIKVIRKRQKHKDII